MTTGIQAILQSSQNSSLCKISIGIKKSSRDYLSIILTEIPIAPATIYSRDINKKLRGKLRIYSVLKYL